MLLATLALIVQTNSQVDAKAIDSVNSALSIKVERQEFPSPDRLKAQCDASPQCSNAREQARIEAEHKRLEQKNQTQLFTDGFHGNTYSFGNCTYFVAGKRNVGAYWGNARNWFSMAQASGYEVGDKPFKGAIAWTPAGWAGHVALVTEVNGDMVTIEEMNYIGFNKTSIRTVHFSEFKYIYG